MKKWTVATILAAKGHRKLGCVTSYDACFARLADEAGAPMILVGDSMGNNVLGYRNTLPVTLENTLAATAAVARAVKDALVIADLPFGSYQVSDDKAVESAVACLKAGAEAVKLEGGAFRASLVRRLVLDGIPVVTHVGLTPQSVNQFGGFKMQAKTREAADKMIDDVKTLEAAGSFAVTLECVPDEVAAQVTASTAMVTIGIGAGPVCDAQWLVMHDLLGLNEHSPKFVKRYAELGAMARNAFASYVNEVADGTFPSARE